MGSHPCSRLVAIVSALLALGLIPVSTRAAEPTTRPIANIQHVLIISIDGLRPDLILRTATPAMHGMMEQGAFTLWARTIPAAITLPSHVSMLTGVSPEAHGIMWNADLPLEKPVYPNAPTLFELARKAGLSTAMAAGKSKLNVMNKPGTIDWAWGTATNSESTLVTAAAQRILIEHRPDVLFVHLPTVDNVGHSKGWGSPEQLAAVEQADRCVGQLLETLDQLELRQSTLVIVTADHGGAGRTHGPEDARSRTIPWLLSGPGVRKGFDLTRLGGDFNVDTYDTFATSCAVLGVPVQRRTSGKFVSQAFEQQELILPGTPPSMAPATLPTTQPTVDQGTRQGN